MSKSTRIVVAIYGLWCLIWVILGVAEIGDGFKAAHLTLMFSAPPLSLLSFYLPHGSAYGTIAAAILGLVQWGCVAEMRERYLSWKAKN